MYFGEQEERRSDVKIEGVGAAVASLERDREEECPMCDASVSSLEKHREKSTTCQPWTCWGCEETFDSVKLNDHIRVCDEWLSEYRYENCEYCSEEIDTWGDKILQHDEICHDHLYSCDFCQEVIDMRDEEEPQHGADCDDWLIDCAHCGAKISKTVRRPRERAIYHDDGCPEIWYSCTRCSGIKNKKHPEKSNHDVGCPTRSAAEGMIGEKIEEDHHVYVLKLRGDSGEEYYYVGESGSVDRRVRTHIRGTDECNNMDVVDVVEVAPVEPDEANIEERRKWMELAQEHGVPNVLGGR